MCEQRDRINTKRGRMQRSLRPPNPLETTYVNSNPIIWIHPSKESRQANPVLFETVQQLRVEMKNLRTDNK